MLAAGAKAGRTRAAYFGARLDAWAGDFLERVLVVEHGPAAQSGAGLTAHTPAPEGRAAVTTLVRALEALRDAVDYRRVSGGPEAFENAVQAGVSRELVESVAELVRGATAAQLSVAWSAAVGTPGGFGDRRIVLEFSPGTSRRWRRPPRCWNGSSRPSPSPWSASSSGSSAPTPRAPAPSGCGCSAAPRSARSRCGSPPRPTGWPPRPTWPAPRYGSAAGWSGAAASAGSPTPRPGAVRRGGR
ncbi:hypothetical protein ACFQ0M_12920 [Kitasatospora aburaviensis]